MEKEIVMTYAGLRALEDELEQLKTVKRKEVAEKDQSGPRLRRPFRKQ